MITVQDIKDIMTITTSGDDANISEYITSAYHRLPFNFTPAGSGTDEIIEEVVRTDDEGYFHLKYRTKTCTIESLSYLDTSNYVFTLDSVTDNVKNVGGYKYHYIMNNATLKVLYSPDNFEEALDEIVKEIVVWDYNKLLNKEGNMIKNSAVLGGEVNINYKLEEQFNKEISNRLMKIYLHLGV